MCVSRKKKTFFSRHVTSDGHTQSRCSGTGDALLCAAAAQAWSHDACVFKQNKTKQNKTKQNKTKQNKTMRHQSGKGVFLDPPETPDTRKNNFFYKERNSQKARGQSPRP